MYYEVSCENSEACFDEYEIVVVMFAIRGIYAQYSLDAYCGTTMRNRHAKSCNQW